MWVSPTFRCRGSISRGGGAPAAQYEALTPAAGLHDVFVDTFGFSPAKASGAGGTTITWMNPDDVPQTIVSAEQKSRSPALDADEQFSHRFDVPGTYQYFCGMHPK